MTTPPNSGALPPVPPPPGPTTPPHPQPQISQPAAPPLHQVPSPGPAGYGAPVGFAPYPGSVPPVAVSPVALELRKIGTAWHVPALAVVIVVGVGLAMSASMLAMLSSILQFVASGSNVVQQVLFGFGVVLGGGVATEGASSLSGHVGLASISTIALIGLGAYLVARRAARRETGTPGGLGAIVVRSVIEAMPAALIALFVSIFGRVGNTVVLLTPSLLGVLATVWITVALALVIARMRGRGVSRWGLAGALVREPVWYSGVLVGVMSIGALLVLVVRSISEGDLMFLLWLPYGANLGAYAAVLGQFGPVEVGNRFGTGPVMAWDVIGSFAIVLILVTLFVLLYLTVFIGARRGRVPAVALARVWQLPVGMFIVTVLFTYTIGAVTASGLASTYLDPSGERDVWIGLSFAASLIIAGFALLVSLLAETMPSVVYTISPAFFAFLVGRRTAHAWFTGTSVVPAVFSGGPLAGGFAGGGQPGGFSGGGLPGHQPGIAVGAAAVPFSPAAVSPSPSAPAPVNAAAGVVPEFVHPQYPSLAPQPGQVPVGFAGYNPPAPPPRAPMSRKTKRTLIATFVSVGVIGVLLGGAAIALTVINAGRGPEAQVKEYLAHLANGDAEAAAAMVPLTNKGKTPVLAGADVFGAEGVTHIEVGKLTTDIDGESGFVNAKLKLGEESFTAKIAVSHGDPEFGVLTTWQIDKPLLYQVNIAATGTNEVLIAGTSHTLETDGATASGSLWMYPGIYPVEAASDSKFFSGDSTSLRVGAADKATASLHMSATDALEEAIIAEVQEFVTSCAEVPTNMTPECPYEVQNTKLASLEVTSQVSELTWFDGADPGFESGSATITIVPNPTSFNPKPSAEKVTFTVWGEYSVDGDTLDVDISYSW